MEGGPSVFPQGSTCLVVLRIPPRSLTVSPTGLSPPLAGLPRPFGYRSGPLWRSIPQGARTLVWAVPRSLAATYGIEFSFFSSGYLDVSVPRVPLHALWIGAWIRGVSPRRFPHSEIHGSQAICASPWLIAAYHVFHRLLVPRHPPCALSA